MGMLLVLLRLLPMTKIINILISRYIFNLGVTFYKATMVELYPTVKKQNNKKNQEKKQ